jgi:hypothetical protein
MKTRNQENMMTGKRVIRVSCKPQLCLVGVGIQETKKPRFLTTKKPGNPEIM